MAKTARTAVPGTIGDPAAQKKSGQGSDKRDAAPSDALVKLLISKAKSSGVDNPNIGVLTAFLVQEIDLQCNDLIQYHRTIANGVENAGNQVRDMRIQWNEAGPEPSFAQEIVEFLIVTFVVMPLISKLVGLAFRFVAEGAVDVAIAQRRAFPEEVRKFQEMAAQRAAPLKAEAAVEEAALSQAEALLAQGRRMRQGTAPGSVGGRQIPLQVTTADAADVIDRLEREVEERQARITRLSLDQAKQLLALEKKEPKVPVDRDAIQQFFDRKNEQFQDKTIPISLAPIAKREVAGIVEGAPRSRAFKPAKGAGAAADSSAVQLESLAQTFLRSMERYFDNIKANAQAVLNVATAQPATAVAAFAFLCKMHRVLSGGGQVLDEGFVTPEQLAELKEQVALDAEHKIWAMLIGDKYKQYIWTDFDAVGPSEVVTMVKSWLTAPPRSVITYLRERFYEGDARINNLTILTDLEKIRKDFLEINKNALAGRRPIEEKEFVLPSGKAN
jgi:hypothetical protein